MQLSQEEIDNLKNQEREQDRRDEIKRVHSTILKEIQNPKPRAGERAIWELVQNARDLSNETVVKITLKAHSIEFSHKGEPFTRRTLRSLIMQQSSKSVGDENAGQYGTGFMTTHAFNLKVSIKGSMLCELPDRKLYASLPSDFCLDRSLVGVNEENFIIQTGNILDSVDELKNGSLFETPSEWTTFIYDLDEDKQKKVAEQVDITTKLMPYVLVFNPRIKECTIENELTNQVVKYEKSTCPSTTQMSYDSNVNLLKHDISVIENGTEHLVEIRMLQTSDGKDSIIIPPLPHGLDDVTKIPSEFLFFPMLGSEEFGVNFIFNSQRLYPTEPRDSYQFPMENSSNSMHLDKVINTNKEVLENMFQILLEYYRHNPQEQHLSLPFAAVTFKRNYEDSITEEYFNQLQNLFSEEFAKWQMIPTSQGYKAINSSDIIQVKVLEPAIYKDLDEEQLTRYIPIITKYAVQIPNVLLPSENIVEWSHIVYGWASEKQQYYITLEQICQSIKENTTDLAAFLTFLASLGNKGEELMKTYPLIPNRKGELCKRETLRNGKTITKSLYDIAAPLLGNDIDKLVDEKFADIVELTEYTRKDLANEMTNAIRKMRENTLKIDSAQELSTEEITNLIKYCSAYNTQPAESNFRSSMMPLICEVYGQKYELQVIEKFDQEDYELYGNAFNLLLDNTLLYLSKKTCDSTSWLTTDDEAVKNKDLLLRFVKAFSVSKSEDNITRLGKYSIFPNQNKKLCIQQELKKNLQIDQDLQNLYQRIFSQDLKEKFVDEEFAEIVDFEEYKPKDVSRELDEKLKENNYKDNEVLFILQKLTVEDNILWQEWFDNIYNQKAILYFEHGSEEDKKALFDLQMQGSETLKRIAELSKHPDFESIIQKAERDIEEQRERERQFQFTFAIGTLIEEVIRQEVGDELQVVKPQSFDVNNVQGGQDIVINYHNKTLYRIECKAKWVFDSEHQAHMSSLQMKRAVEDAEAYALCCIDCTLKTGCNVSPDATQEEVNAAKEDIRAHTYVHTNIGKMLSPMIKPLVEHEKEKDIQPEEQIRVYSNLSCNIPKKVFIDGTPFDTFIEELKVKLKKMI